LQEAVYAPKLNKIFYPVGEKEMLAMGRIRAETIMNATMLNATTKNVRTKNLVLYRDLEIDSKHMRY